MSSRHSCELHNFLNTRSLITLRYCSHFAPDVRASTVAAGSQGQTMRASDCPTVDTTEFLLAALEQASEAVVIIDADLHVSHFNAAAESIWGVARDDILGLDASCLGLTDLGPNSEITIRRADGSRLRASVSASRVEIGGRSSYMVFVRDITAEVERRERIALLNLVADKTTRAVVVTDRNLRVVYTNAAFSGMFGYSAEEAQGRQANQLLAGRLTDRKTLLRLRRRICDGRGDEEEVLAYDKNGDEIWVSATVKAFRNDRGRIKYVFALLSDISENKQLRSLQQLIMGALADELPITEIADQLCRRVEAIAPDVVASVLHVDSDGLLHPLGGPSLPDDYSRALEGVPIGPDVGSCGSAAYYGKPVLAEDLDTDPRWQPYKTRPLEVGLKACWSTPIKAKDGRVIGTFAFYFKESAGAEPLASADRRRLRSPRCAGDRAQGSPRPDRPARLPRHADRAAEPRAVARVDQPGHRDCPAESNSR